MDTLPICLQSMLTSTVECTQGLLTVNKYRVGADIKMKASLMMIDAKGPDMDNFPFLGAMWSSRRSQRIRVWEQIFATLVQKLCDDFM